MIFEIHLRRNSIKPCPVTRIMEVYTYHYNCKRWYGNVAGTRNLYLEGTVHPEEAAREDAKTITGSSECDIQLVQKFTMMVTDVETFPAMACLPLFKYSETT